MSLPAREAERWAPAPAPLRRAVTPARPPAARPSIPDQPPHPHRRTRRGHHSAFWLLTAAIVSALVVGLVSLNAMRVDAAYRSRSVTARVRLLTDERRLLVNDVARLSSPSRIGTWARRSGLVAPAPGDIVILQVPGNAGAPAAELSSAG